MSAPRPRARQRAASHGAADGRRCALPASATIRVIETIRGELLAMMERQDAIEIDAAAVTEADLSLVQLLLAARKAAQQSGKTLVLARPVSGALRDVLLRGGFLAPGAPRKEEDAFWLQGASAP